jgi:hypothetical protein
MGRIIPYIMENKQMFQTYTFFAVSGFPCRCCSSHQGHRHLSMTLRPVIKIRLVESPWHGNIYGNAMGVRSITHHILVTMGVMSMEIGVPSSVISIVYDSICLDWHWLLSLLGSYSIKSSWLWSRTGASQRGETAMTCQGTLIDCWCLKDLEVVKYNTWNITYCGWTSHPAPVANCWDSYETL